MSGLHDLSVFLDFDGTVAAGDSSRVLLDTYGDGSWRELDAALQRGEISSRECIVDQWAKVRGVPQADLLATARAIPLDPGFESLLAYLRDGGAEVAIVSDGFGFWAREVAAAHDVRILTNDVDWAAGELVFPNEDRCCACSSCGTCKQAPIKDAQARGRWTVMVGDGATDRKAASLADVVFAKDALADWCRTFDVPYRPFVTLADVQAGIADIV
jgi:2-hydroxy-3-keto-5-methylthiopentenyl-1-phosphate phosphatase